MLTFFPILSSAQDDVKVESLQDFFAKLTGLLGSLVQLIFGIALLSFLWGVFKYALASDPKDRDTALGFMKNGIIALFVMVSVWGFVFMVREFFGFEQSTGVNWFPETGEKIDITDGKDVNLLGDSDGDTDLFGNPGDIDLEARPNNLDNLEKNPFTGTPIPESIP